MTMEANNEKMIRDYNLAVQSYNKSEYDLFFRNIRPAIERISKFIIHEIWEDRNQAESLINGTNKIYKDRYSNSFKFSTSKADITPKGKGLVELAERVLYCKHPNIYSSQKDEDKWVKRRVEAFRTSLCDYYNFSSGLGSHTGNTDLDHKIQARSCAAFLMGFFDFIKNQTVFSDSAIKMLDSLDAFSFGDDVDTASFEEQVNQLIKDAQEKEMALLNAQKLQNEAEQREQDSKLKLEELQAENQKYEEELRALRQEIASMTSKKESDVEEYDSKVSLIGDDRWDVTEETMDDDQLDLIEYTTDKSMLVAGCAGSGKSVIAMHKAEQLYKAGHDVILIAYTKSLNSFMKNGSTHSAYRFFYYHQWKKKGMPSADYIIVDEIQDFTKEQINEFINSAKKHYLFFGDTAQSIYRTYGNTMSMEQISSMTGLNVLRLYNNYRLPRPIAKITQTYVGINVPEYKDKVYQNKETELPHFVYYDSDESQLTALMRLASENSDKSVGVLLPNNSEVLRVCSYFRDNGQPYEFKYNSPDDKSNINNLDFRTKLPKVMTYHSAKGLQFDIVILPFYKGAADDESRTTLYVAMTRTMRSLYVLYSAPEIPSPLDVPSHLYLKE